MQPAQAAPINPAQYQQQQQWYHKQSQYQQPPQPPQQYALPPQQQYALLPQQPVYYPQQAAVAPPQQAQAAGDEIRTLWIGDLQYFMDENYLLSCFSQSGEVLSDFVLFALILCVKS